MEVDGPRTGDGAEGFVATELERRAAGDGEGGSVRNTFVTLRGQGSCRNRGASGVGVDSREGEVAGAALEEAAVAGDGTGNRGVAGTAHGQECRVGPKGNLTSKGEVAAVTREEDIFRQSDVGVDRLGIRRVVFDIPCKGDRVVGDGERRGPRMEDDAADRLIGVGINGGLVRTGEIDERTGDDGWVDPVGGVCPVAVARAAGPGVVGARRRNGGDKEECVSTHDEVATDGEIADGVEMEVTGIERGNASASKDGEVAGGVAEVAKVKDNRAVEGGVA